MRRRVDFKFLACLLGALLVAAVGVHFLHAFQVRRNARSLLQQADRASEQDAPEKAAEYLRRYLVYVPGDTDARARYGLILGKAAKSTAEDETAFLALSQVLREQPQRDDVRREFIPVAMRLWRFTEAQESLGLLMKALGTDDEQLNPGQRQQLGHFEELLGQCSEGRKEYNKAADWYDKATQHAPQEINTYLLLSGLLRKHLNQPDRADWVMDQLVAANEGVAQAYLLRGLYRHQHGARDGGANDIQKAYALDPDRAEVLLAMAEVALDGKVKDFDKARGYLRHGLELHPDDAALYGALAKLEGAAGRRPEAIACLRRGLKAVPEGQQGDLLWALAELLVEKEETAAEAFESVRRAGFPRPELDYLHGRLLITKGQWFQAARELERTRPNLQRWPALQTKADLLLGQCYRQLSNPDQQYAAYRRAEKQGPSSVAASLGVASALVALDKLDEALQVYRQLAPRLSGAQLDVARLLIVQNERRPPAERQWQEVDQILKAVAKAAPDLLDGPLMQAEVEARKGDIAAARSILLAARAKQPKEVRVWTALAGLEALNGKGEKVLPVLDEAERLLGDRVELRLARARYWARHGGAEARQPLARLSQDLDKFSVADRSRLLRGLAEAYAWAGDLVGARQLCSRLAEQQPADLGVRTAEFDLALQAGDDRAMADVLAAIRDVEGVDGTLYRYGQACYLIWQAKHGKPEGLDQARGLLDLVAQRRPAWASVAVCAAEINALKGDRPAAARDYLRAVNDLGNRNPRVIRALVELLNEQQRYAEADQVLRKLPEQASLSPDMLRLTAAVSLETHDYDRALSLAQRAVSAQPQDYRDHLWLGQLLSQLPARQKEKEAEGAFRRAATLAPDKPAVWVALVRFLADRGDKEKVRAVIQEAQRQLPKAEAPLALASCYEALGDTGKAKQLYEAARSARPEDVAVLRGLALYYLRRGQPKEAEPYLRKIMDLAAKFPDEAAWARPALAVVLAAGGDYQQSREALNMLGLLGDKAQAAAPDRGSVEDQRARAVVLATQKDRRQRREAIAILENLMTRQPPTADDRFFLALLYDGVGDWPQARAKMLLLLNGQEEKALYLASFLHALLRHEELGEAQNWLDKFEQLPAAHGSFTAAEIKARLLAARGQAGAAVAVLEGYVANKDAKPAESATRRQFAVGVLDNLSRRFSAEKSYAASAETMYRAWVKQRPENVLALAKFLGRQGQTGEALDLCERAWQTGPVEAAAIASLTVLKDGQPSPEQVGRVERWLDAALAKSPEAPGLLFYRAYLRGIQGRHAEEESLYREVLRRDPQNALALNNLALAVALPGESTTEALELINRAIARQGAVPALRNTRAVVYLQMGRSDLATADLEEARLEDPEDAATYFHLAQAYDVAKKPDEVRKSFHKALALGLRPSDLHLLARPAYEEFLRKWGPG